jgi:hypothetical protein
VNKIIYSYKLKNEFYKFNGLLIAGLLNNTNKGGGGQRGLFNRCKDCKGVQTGLLNKIGKKAPSFFKCAAVKTTHKTLYD